MDIHIVRTGGTIGAARTNDPRGRGPALAPAKPGAAPLAVPAGIRVSESRPMNILSENMTLTRWRELLSHIGDLALDGKDGLIVTHGTDTLAHTACLLSLALSPPKLPVMLVSANRPPEDPASNGGKNLAAALAAIEENIPPGVYATYANSDGRTYLHAGAELLQCPCGSEDFFSVFYGGAAGDPLAEIVDGKLRCRKARPAPPPARGFAEAFDGRFRRVLAIRPYVGLHYDDYALDKADAVLHGLYHSHTAAAFEEEGDGSASILYLAKRCARAGIPLCVAPFPPALARGEREGGVPYETTARMLDAGIVPISGVTFEMALAMLTLGLAPGIG
ncbi:MAG: asparaginase domain-containing protein [Clostridiales Family XIII bacterium]|jgi:L-asparaginase|nr:asparaginase domain-containing protein [Clostridiales Family XIII bacterium]